MTAAPALCNLRTKLRLRRPEDRPGSFLGASWGGSWRPLGGFLGALGGLLEPLGASWVCLGGPLETIRFLNATWKRLGGDLGPSWGRLGAILGSSWRLLGPLGAVLAPLGTVLGPLWRLLGPSWGPLESSGGPLEASWGPVGAILRLSWTSQGADRRNSKNIQKPKENQRFWEVQEPQEGSKGGSRAPKEVPIEAQMASRCA